MKRILLVATQYRTGERIYNTIPILANRYNIDLLKIYQMSPKHKWIGSIDMKAIFDAAYLRYFSNVYDTISDVDYKQYDLIIFDDNRERNNLDDIYLMDHACPVAACEHGNRDLSKIDSLKNKGLVFDYGFVFGNKTSGPDLIPIGIPSNDALMKYTEVEKKHILVIVNFLGNRSAPFRRFDNALFNELPLKMLQNYYKVPILIKLKSRDDEQGYIHNIDYLKEVMPNDVDYSVIVDVENDNKLIAESHCVISAPSTLAFKPIQLGIPTVLLKETGQTGLFYDFTGLISIKKQSIFNEAVKQKKQVEFIQNTIAGGNQFNSTAIFINEVNKLCNVE